jgi:hypothetical protein
MRGRTGSVVRALRRSVRATESTCYRCGQAIDWSIPHLDPLTGTVNNSSGTLEHKQSVALHPELAEDRGNCAASHWLCNVNAGADSRHLPLGQRSRSW